MPLTWHSYELVSLLWFVIRPPSTSQITCTAVIEKQHPHQWWRHSSHILQIPFPPSFSYSLWQHLTVSKAQVLATQFPFPLNISVQEQLCFYKDVWFSPQVIEEYHWNLKCRIPPPSQQQLVGEAVSPSHVPWCSGLTLSGEPISLHALRQFSPPLLIITQGGDN